MKKWLRRILVGMASAGLSFVIISIITKLLFGYEDWLYRTIMMSAPWAGITLLKYHFVVDKGWKQGKFALTVAAIVFVTTLFITGVALSLSDYWKHAWYITFCFTYPTFMATPQDN